MNIQNSFTFKAVNIIIHIWLSITFLFQDLESIITIRFNLIQFDLDMCY